MLPLKKEESKSHQEPNVCYICRKRILKNISKCINYRKVRVHCNYKGKCRGAAHDICDLELNEPNKILVVFRNGSNYGYHFIIKELANKSDGKFEYHGENIEK